MNCTLLCEKYLFCLGLICSGGKIKIGVTFLNRLNCLMSDVLSTSLRSRWNKKIFINILLSLFRDQDLKSFSVQISIGIIYISLFINLIA